LEGYVRNARIDSILSIPLLFCSFRCSLPWQAGSDPDFISIVSYNVQNLCDASDSGLEYAEFKVGSGTWTEAKYRKRLENTSKAIKSLAQEDSAGPDILCLVEAENMTVLDDLRSRQFPSAGYRTALMAPSLGSPINCGILSRFVAKNVLAHNLDCIGSGSRYMLEATFDCGDGNELTIFLCHWKSRIESARETEEARIQAATLLKGRITSLLGMNPESEILVCGDFNESPDEFERSGSVDETAFMPFPESGGDSAVSACRGLLVTASPEMASFDSRGPVLFSPWERSGGFSYYFGESRDRLDGFLLSPGLCDRKGLGFAGFKVSDAAFLVSDSGHPLGWRGNAGYSDHLPIALTLSRAK
jgi:endonuclease/exonuclease/phosphatase family metal-dependent hydrolase